MIVVSGVDSSVVGLDSLCLVMFLGVVFSCDFILNDTFSLSKSISITFTFTCCHKDTTSIGCQTYLSAICDLCTSPSLCRPISTNAPNSVIFLTTHSSCIPILRSSISMMSAENAGGVRSSLGSCPGR